MSLRNWLHWLHPSLVAVLACMCSVAACSSDASQPSSMSPLVVTDMGSQDEMMALVQSSLIIDDDGCSFLNDGSSPESGVLAAWPGGSRIDLGTGAISMPYSAVSVEAGHFYLFTGGSIDVDSPLIARDLGARATRCLQKAAKTGVGAFLVGSVEPCTAATRPDVSLPRLRQL